MKRLFSLLFLLPLLASCTVENDYYDNGYYYQPPRARVEVPYGNSYRAAPQTHYHYSERPVAYRGSSQHGHRNVAPHNKRYSYRKDSNSHGHESNSDVKTHGHGNAQADVRAKGYNNTKNSSAHGHDSVHGQQNGAGNTVHGHD